MRSAVLAAAAAACLLPETATAFSKLPHRTTFNRSSRPLFANAAVEEAAALKAQAEKIRLEAEKMDVELTLEKVNSLEKKLSDKTWREKHPDQEAELRRKLEDLTNKLQGKPPTKQRVTRQAAETTTTEIASSAPSSSEQPKKKESLQPAPLIENDNPIAGFDPQDLELYMPVALQIEETMANATMDAKLEAFRKEPTLQKHFSDKIQGMLLGPMEDLQKLEQYKSQYLSSTSSVEKENLKRQIDLLKKNMAKDSPFTFSNSVFQQIPVLTEEELQERVNAIEALPELLQCLYKKRNDVSQDADLRLAILVEHYEPQLQLLDNVRMMSPLDDKSRQEARKGFESLPVVVCEHFCQNIGLPPDSDAVTVVKELEGGASEMNFGAFGKVIVEAASKAVDLPEYSDVEFLDRSRYVEEFIPSFARMEQTRPTEEEIETFCSEVLDKNTFTLTGKPERVMGGYYLPGIKRFEGDGANDKLVTILSEKLQKSSLKDDVQFFFIPDPTPLSDEELESGVNRERPLLAVTSKNTSEFYDLASPQTKLLVSSLGIISTFLFSLGACGMNGDMMDRVQQGLDRGNVDVSWFADSFFTTFVSMLGIQLAHEVAHRLVAWKDKFDIGFPNLIPSMALGLTGAITPLKSPPKNWNSLFDFAVAGPLAGLAASLFLLVNGLGITASMDMSASSQLPALPVLLLHASALGGGLVEMFLGSGVLSTATPETVLPLHPFAVAGFVGLITNALALLPLGHTDGGRMALTIFGRRGFFLVKAFSLLAVCAAGLFGLDNSEILLVYALFVVLWQREEETPALNEVDDLSTLRGLAAFPIMLLVALSLIPLP